MFLCPRDAIFLQHLPLRTQSRCRTTLRPRQRTTEGLAIPQTSMTPSIQAQRSPGDRDLAAALHQESTLHAPLQRLSRPHRSLGVMPNPCRMSSAMLRYHMGPTLRSSLMYLPCVWPVLLFLQDCGLFASAAAAEHFLILVPRGH